GVGAPLPAGGLVGGDRRVALTVTRKRARERGVDCAVAGRARQEGLEFALRGGELSLLRPDLGREEVAPPETWQRRQRGWRRRAVVARGCRADRLGGRGAGEVARPREEPGDARRGRGGKAALEGDQEVHLGTRRLTGAREEAAERGEQLGRRLLVDAQLRERAREHRRSERGRALRRARGRPQ